MLDFDSAIVSWRQQTGIADEAVLDELDNHLREEIERQEQLDSTRLEALEIAIR